MIAASTSGDGTQDRSWVFDLDGVVWRGDEPIANGVAAARLLIERGERVLFVTNFSHSVVGDQEAKLQRLGIAARGRVLTSAMAAGDLIDPQARVLICGGPGIVEAVQQRGALVVTDPLDAEVVVVGFDPRFDFDRLTTACRAVWNGARLVATNDDSTYPSAAGLVPGGGALLAAITYATGVTPTVAGKPYPTICEAVWRRIGHSSAGIGVGDRADTDGAFARALGYRFALVLSGVTVDAAGVDPPPDLVGADALAIVRHVLG